VEAREKGFGFVELAILAIFAPVGGQNSFAKSVSARHAQPRHQRRRRRGGSLGNRFYSFRERVRGVLPDDW
jgi:hypothetical protein